MAGRPLAGAIRATASAVARPTVPEPSVQHVVIVFIGAGIGGVMRHAVNLLALRWLGPSFPFGTLTVNLVGSLAMGLLAGYFALRHDPGQAWRLFLTTGILGGFTTFSAFSLDVAVLYQRGDLASAALYLALSVGLSLAALFLGMALARSLG